MNPDMYVDEKCMNTALEHLNELLAALKMNWRIPGGG